MTKPSAVAAALLATACAGCGSDARSMSRAPGRTAHQAPPVPTTASSLPTPRAVRIRLAASGDFLIHQPVWSRALALGHGRYDFRPLLRAIRPIIRGADVALCHMETPMGPGAPHGYPVFNTPHELARAIRWAGYDVCDTASNHSLDAGQVGIDATARALSRAHLRHTGSFASPAARRRSTILRIKGVPVAFLAYTALTNGLRPPHPWSLNLADPRRIVRDARRARARGARVVIVNLHWGVEYQRAPSTDQLRLVRRLAKSDAITAIVGQHVHVVQPIRRVHGKVVVFGEGNLLSNQTAACCPVESQDGIIALLTIEVAGAKSRVTKVRYVPTWVRHPDFTVLPVRRALRGGWANRGELLASLRRTRAAVGASVARPAH